MSDPQWSNYMLPDLNSHITGSEDMVNSSWHGNSTATTSRLDLNPKSQNNIIQGKFFPKELRHKKRNFERNPFRPYVISNRILILSLSEFFLGRRTREVTIGKRIRLIE